MAAGRLVVPGFFPALDRNGDPVSGAKMYVYENETTTLVVIYSDQSLTTPLANPVTANSAGAWPDIWADGGTDTDLTLYSVSIVGPTGVGFRSPNSFDNVGVTYDAASISAILNTKANLSENTFSDTQTIDPPLFTTAQALVTNQYASGTVTGPTNLNLRKVWSDDINAQNSGGTDYFVQMESVEHYAGGSSMRGGRNTLAAYFYLTAPSAADSDNRNYCALTGVSTALASDGGTSPLASGTSKGAFFGLGAVGVSVSGATALLNVTGAEFNVAMETGSSAWAKSGIQISNRTDDRVKGSVIDASIWIYRQGSSSPVWNDIFLIDNGGGDGVIPFGSTSTLMRTSAGTILHGLDMSATTFAAGGMILRGPNLSMRGDGSNLTLAAPTASIELGAVGSTNSPFFDWHSGAVGVDYDVRMQATGGTGVNGGGDLVFTLNKLAIMNGTLRLQQFTVAALPAAASSQYCHAFVTDGSVAASGNFGAVVAGGGANVVPVYSDGTNWRIG